MDRYAVNKIEMKERKNTDNLKYCNIKNTVQYTLNKTYHTSL